MRVLIVAIAAACAVLPARAAALQANGAGDEAKSAPGARVADAERIAVVFSAGGGTISRRGLFTAGPRGGEYRVIASVGEVAGDMALVVAEIPAAGGGAARAVTAAASEARGVPFGPFGAWRGSRVQEHAEMFSMVLGSDKPDELEGRIQAARAAGKRLLLAMTGGRHDNYKTAGMFDMGKWQARMSEYNTARLQEVVAEAVADGTIIGNSVMDEPHNTSPENSWGPKGTMTKARVDEMCGYVKRIFPTLPVGVVHDHRLFEPDRNYAVCDFVVSQYGARKGSVVGFRDGGLEFARRSRVAIAFSLNILDGGDRVPGCPVPQTGGPGTFRANCRMRADQVREFGSVLGPAGCAFTMWRYDAGFMADAENRRAFEAIAELLTDAPPKPCTRT